MNTHAKLVVIISCFPSFTSKSANLYEIIRVRGAEKQAVSPCDELQKLTVSFHNGLEKPISQARY